MNIVLVGARCSGKTTVGKILSALTGKVFLDTDSLVEEKAGASIETFIAARGWEAFRDFEKEAVKIVSERDDQIIATGGGVVLDEVNVNRLVPNALVVWLEGKAEVLRQRMEKELQSGKRRPSLTGTDPLKEITEVLNAREPFYGRASTLRVDTTGLSPEEVASVVFHAIGEKKRDRFMAGNSFGEVFRITTFGESHGVGVGVVIDGCPSRMALSPEDFFPAMARRRPGRTPLDTPRREEDRVEILSGVFEGQTTGAPIALFIRNRDADSRPYEILRNAFRPGHADYSYFRKYGHFDFRGGGRSSARETAARVAAGVVAQKILEPAGIQVAAWTLELGGIRARQHIPGAVENNPFFCPDPDVVPEMEAAMKRSREEHDSLGGIVEVRVLGCPPGLGEPVFDKLDADLARAVMSVGAVKGVEIGAGFAAARLSGSENNDPLTPAGFRTNRAGGILGGISNGDEIILRAAIKPIPSIKREQDTITRDGEPVKLHLEGRYDISAVPRVVPVLEAMTRIVLADHLLRFRAVK